MSKSVLLTWSIGQSIDRLIGSARRFGSRGPRGTKGGPPLELTVTVKWLSLTNVDLLQQTFDASVRELEPSHRIGSKI